MIAIHKSGSNFFGAVRYVLGLGKDAEHKKVRVIGFEGVDVKQDKEGNLVADPHDVTMSFLLQAGMNPRVKKNVKHQILSFCPEDEELLSDGEMLRVVKDYMKGMGYENTQFLAVRHLEKDNPHVHIVFNVVDNNGKRLKDYKEKLRSVKVCREITERSCYTFGRHLSYSTAVIPLDGKNRVQAAAKNIIAKAVMIALGKINRMEDLPKQLMLDDSGVRVKIKRNDNGKPVGISFYKTMKDDNGTLRTCRFTGRNIDKRMTYSKLCQWLSLKREMGGQIRHAQVTLAGADNEGVKTHTMSELQTLLLRISHEEKRIRKEMPEYATEGYVYIVLAMLFNEKLMYLSTRLEMEISAKKRERLSMDLPLRSSADAGTPREYIGHKLSNHC